MPTLNPDLTYDEAFAALEAVLAQLEDGDLPLEQALALYEEGLALSTLCSRKLADAELRVRQWQGADGGREAGDQTSDQTSDQTRPFEGWQN